MSCFKGKSILVTGGTGSFGRAFARRLLKDFEPKQVIIYSRDEWKQWEMKGSDPIFADPRIRYCLGDVRDIDRLHRALTGVDIVVHAAALKQVPAAEYNPTEFIKTNVIGAMNVIEACIDCGVEKAVALSTGKAVNAANLYGATKLCSDKLFVAANIHNATRFSVVRYGNVLGSRGSIVPLWREMVAEGVKALPVTDDRMTRFWMTPAQAVDVVIDAIEDMHGGEVFVPKVPSAKIVDIASAVAPKTPYTVTGIRPGEKLHEILIPEEEAHRTQEFSRWYVTLPETFDTGLTGGKTLPSTFAYASNTNTSWLSVGDLQDLLAH